MSESTEEDYMILCAGVKETVCILQLVYGLKIGRDLKDATTIHTDNQGAISFRIMGR